MQEQFTEATYQELIDVVVGRVVGSQSDQELRSMAVWDEYTEDIVELFRQELFAAARRELARRERADGPPSLPAPAPNGSSILDRPDVQARFAIRQAVDGIGAEQLVRVLRRQIPRSSADECAALARFCVELADAIEYGDTERWIAAADPEVLAVVAECLELGRLTA